MLVWGSYLYLHASLILQAERTATEPIKGGRVLDLESSDFERILAYLTGKASSINNSKALTTMKSCKNFNQAKIPYSVPRNDAWNCFKELFSIEIGNFKIGDLNELLYRAENYYNYHYTGGRIYNTFRNL